MYGLVHWRRKGEARRILTTIRNHRKINKTQWQIYPRAEFWQHCFSQIQFQTFFVNNFRYFSLSFLCSDLFHETKGKNHYILQEKRGGNGKTSWFRYAIEVSRMFRARNSSRYCCIKYNLQFLDNNFQSAGRSEERALTRQGSAAFEHELSAYLSRKPRQIARRTWKLCYNVKVSGKVEGKSPGAGTKIRRRKGPVKYTSSWGRKTSQPHAGPAAHLSPKRGSRNLI